MKKMIFVIALVLLAQGTQARALEMNKKNAVILGGLGFGALGLVLGTMKGADADDAYDAYKSETDSDKAVVLWNEHEKKVDDSNAWFTIGYLGLGVGAGAYLLDYFYLSRSNTFSMNTVRKNGTTMAALTIRY